MTGAKSGVQAPYESARAVFLDRDGTLIVDHGFVGDPERVELLPHVPRALRRLRAAGYLLFSISNQSGVARGYFDAAAVEAVDARVGALLADAGARLDAAYYCPHLGDACACRKPKAGMLERAAREHDLRLDACVTVGDRGRDLAAGRAAGTSGVFVLTHELVYDGPLPDAVAPHLDAATDWILAR